MDTASSTASVFACKTPSISTSRSNSDFTIQEESNLTGEDILYSGMTEAMAKLSIDGSILPSISSSDNICHVGIALLELLSRNFFLGRLCRRHQRDLILFR